MMELAAAAPQRARRDTHAGAWIAEPDAFAAAVACAVLLLLGGCQRAEPDYQACASASASVMSGPPDKQLVAPDIQKCMAAKGWRLLRPSLPPGSNAWARIPSDNDPAVPHRPPPPEAGEHRSK